VSDNGKVPTRPSSQTEVDAFLRRVAEVPPPSAVGERGRLLFALDATASRQPTWDRASRLQGEMFRATADLGGLEMQLAFYRGFGEFRASPWLRDSGQLLRMMTSTFCLAGETQIGKVLRHAINQTKERKANALVFVGDAVEENVDRLGALAGELGLLGVPAFMFQEGADPLVEFAFRQVAKLTNGAYCRFDAASADTLRELLKAVAVYAAGGRKALAHYAEQRGGESRLLIGQMKGS